MAPTTLSCSTDGYEFSTPLNCRDWDKMVKLLEIHMAALYGAPTTVATTTVGVSSQTNFQGVSVESVH